MLKQNKKIILAIIIVLIIIYCVKYIIMRRESMSQIYNTVYNKLAEDKPIYTKNNKIVEHFFNAVKDYDSKETPQNIASAEEEERRTLATPSFKN